VNVDTLVNGRSGELVAAADRGLHYGDGLFETIVCRDGRPRWLPLHLARLQRGAVRLGIEPPPQATLAAEVGMLAASQPACIVKLIVTRGIARGRGYRPGGDEQPTRVLSRHPWPVAPAPMWRLGISPVPLGENPRLAGLKHLNRLEQVLAQRERPPQLDEVVMLSSAGEVISGSMSNLFMVEGERLVTPSLERCGVEGVMRGLVLEAAPALGWRTAIETVSVARLRSAAALFVTNVRLGLQRVASIDGADCGSDPRLQGLVEAIDALAG
jgi:4-amino-4-deoxychorismate lyase